MAKADHSGFNLIDDAADPSAAGEIQRNGADLKFHDGTAARTLVKAEDAPAITQGALTHDAAWFSLSDPGAAGAWVRIATITIEAQYRECEIYGRINQQSNTGTTNCDVWSTRFSFTIRQQQALASAPATEFRLLKNRSTGDVKAYITQNDGSATVVKIFAFVPDCWSTRINYDVHYKISDADVGIVFETSEQVEVPAGTEITGLTYLSNIDTLLLDDMAADPSAAGELQRNDRNLNFFGALIASQLSKDEYYDRIHLHVSDFTNFGSNAPGTGSITKSITRARIVITDAVLTDWGEIYAPIFSHGAQLCHIDSKKCWMHTRITVHDDNFAGADQAEIDCGWIRYLGANVWVGFKITFQRDDATNTVTYRFYAENSYWTGAAYAQTTSANPVLTLTFTSDSYQSADLFFYSTGSNLYCWTDWDSTTVQTVSVQDDNNQSSAEVDFYLKRIAVGFNLDMEINQLTFTREW